MGFAILAPISSGSAQGLPSATPQATPIGAPAPAQPTTPVETLAGSPSILISNGRIKAKVYLPDPQNGFYRGTRFDWSGVIGSLVFENHEFYSPWFTRTSPNVVDFAYDGSDIIAGPSSAITGPVEEFSTNGSALGFNQARPGGTFFKIGVGVLTKPDDAAYSAYRHYPIVDHGHWTVHHSSASVDFTHEVNDKQSRYGYRYTKTVRLMQDQPTLLIEHRLINTGSREISSLVYNHNFLNIDGHGIRAGLTISLPFQLQIEKPLTPDLAAVSANQIRYLKPLSDEETVASPILGFGPTATDYDIRISDPVSNAGVEITADQPLARLSLWSIRSVMAIEPFINMTIQPGKEFSWTYSYRYTGAESVSHPH